MEFLLLAGLASSTHSFSLHGRNEPSMAKISTALRSEREISQATNEWSLELDWMLLDAVPRYTISSGQNSNNRVTFWNRVKRATSEFEGRSDEELERRYRAISDTSDSNYTIVRPRCGPAPPVLADWWHEDSKNVMGGTVENGAAIWFYVQSGGTLENNHGMGVMYAPGGFVEAKDGLIYELGPSAATSELGKAEQAVLESPLAWIDSALNPQKNVLAEIPLAFMDSAPNAREFLPLATNNARKMILVAITASSLLSATLAFGIGQQMASSTPPSSLPRQVKTLSTTAVARVPSSQTSRSQLGDISIQEQRARQEVRVLRERRAMSWIEESLQRDEEKLVELQKEETRQEGAALGFY